MKDIDLRTLDNEYIGQVILAMRKDENSNDNDYRLAQLIMHEQHHRIRVETQRDELTSPTSRADEHNGPASR